MQRCFDTAILLLAVVIVAPCVMALVVPVEVVVPSAVGNLTITTQEAAHDKPKLDKINLEAVVEHDQKSAIWSQRVAPSRWYRMRANNPTDISTINLAEIPGIIAAPSAPIPRILSKRAVIIDIEDELNIKKNVNATTDLNLEQQSVLDALTGFEVIGGDDRFRMAMHESARMPWTAIGRLEVGCTGTLIGPRHLLTAGHCIYNADKWQTQLDFVPGLDDPLYVSSRLNEFPIGMNKRRIVGWREVYVTAEWVDKGQFDLDLAVIVLDKRFDSWIPLMTPPQTALDVLIVGYPLDKGLNSLWSAHGQAHMQSSNIGGENVASSATWATHDVDTKQGNSGALCLVKIEGAGDVNGAMEYAAVAVHNGYMKVTGLNYASVVTDDRKRALCTLMRMSSVSAKERMELQQC